jgi:hypothetical protein
MPNPHAEGFKAAAQKEFEDLGARDTFKEVDTPIGKQVIPVKWVFKYKFDSDGYLIKYKARLVV